MICKEKDEKQKELEETKRNSVSVPPNSNI